eukprot:sb/3478076/
MKKEVNAKGKLPLVRPEVEIIGVCRTGQFQSSLLPFILVLEAIMPLCSVQFNELSSYPCTYPCTNRGQIGRHFLGFCAGAKFFFSFFRFLLFSSSRRCLPAPK